MARNTFKMTTGPNTSWSCPITCAQCTYIKANGQQCNNRVCYGSPWCWVHNRMVYGIKSRPSTIAGAGKGLFATKPFQTNDWICPMICEPITDACLQLRYPGDITAPYADTDVDEGIITDCACSRGIGSQANGKFRQDGFVSHARYHNALTVYRNELGIPPGIWLQARRAIAANAEIFLWYGDNADNAYRLQHNHTTRRVTSNDTRPC